MTVRSTKQIASYRRGYQATNRRSMRSCPGNLNDVLLNLAHQETQNNQLGELAQPPATYWPSSAMFRWPAIFEGVARSNRDLHKSTKISLSYSWEGIMQALPWVTHGKDLCKTRHELLMERNYAKRVLHKSFIIYSLYTIFMGRIYAKVEKSRYLIIAF